MDFTGGGILGRTMALVRRVQQMEIPIHAANAGYFMVMSVFPGLVLILSILRYTELDAQDLMRLLEGFLPAALLPSAEKLIVSTYAQTSTAVVSVSAVGALWSASRGIYGVIRGLNAIFDQPQKRGYWQIRGLCVFYTVLLLMALPVTLVIHVFGEALLAHLQTTNVQLWRWLTNVMDLRHLLMLMLQTGLFAGIFAAAPRKKCKFSTQLPGALMASIGWMLFTELFSYYAAYFQKYSSIYGSVYTVVLAMLWLYCCLSILFYGGALNQLLEEKSQ